MKKSEEVSHIEALLKEYDELLFSFEEYRSSMQQTLESILQNSTLQYQAINSNVKKADSLKKKLSDRTYVNIKSVKTVNDVARGRITFYTDQEAQQFVSLLHDQFKVFDVKPHHDDNGYNGTNITIGYNSDRLKLPEYAKYKGLRFEVQVTTVLYHAWNEIAHDTIYKPSINQDKFADKMQILDKRMKLAVKKLLKLQNEFDFIKKLNKQLSDIEPVYKQEYLDSILNAKDTGFIHDNLNALYEVVQNFGYRFDDEVNIIEFIVKLHTSLSSKKISSRESIFGETTKITGDQIVLDILKFLKLNGIRYSTVSTGIELGLSYYQHPTEDISKAAKELIEDITKYNYHVLNKAGFVAQLETINVISKLNDKQLVENKSAIANIISLLAQPSYEVHDMKDYKTISWGSGHLVANENLKKIRNDTFTILTKIYKLSDGGFKELFNAAQSFCQYPHQGDVSEELEAQIVNDTEQVYQLYLDCAPKLGLHDLKDLDEQLQFLERKYKEDPHSGIARVRKFLEENEEYLFFRMLVGYDMRHSVDTDWKEADKLREEFTDKTAEEINDTNFEKWRKKIVDVAATYNEEYDIGEYENLGRLIYKLAKAKPELAIKLFKRNQSELKPFFFNLLLGLSDNKTKDYELEKIFKEYAAKTDYLNTCILYTQQVDRPIRIEDFRNLFSLAKSNDNQWAMALLLGAITRKYTGDVKQRKLFIDVMDQLTYTQNTSWLRRVYFQDLKIINDMNKSEVNKLLSNLIYADRIDHEIELILEQIKSNNLKTVIEFFINRIKYESTIKKENRRSRYDATPYNFYELNNDHSFVSPEVFEILNEKIKGLDKTTRIQLGSFICSILDNTNPETIISLEKYLLNANSEMVSIIASSLWNIKDQDVKLFIIQKLLINPAGKSKTSTFSGAVFSTGVVSGKYGIANAHEETVKKLSEWLNHENNVVKQFAKKEIAILKKHIAAEKRRSDQREDEQELDFMY